MILIKSKTYERTTDLVIEWLAALNIEVVRVNEDNPIVSADIQMNNTNAEEPVFEIKFKDGKVVHSSEVKSFWARRGRFKPEWDEQHFKDKLNSVATFRGSLFEEIRKEWQTLESFLVNVLSEKKKSLSNPAKEDFNKLEILQMAAKAGLKIPPTLVTNQRSVLKTCEEKLITKALSEAVSMKLEGDEFYALTKSLGINEIAQLQETFFPSYFQKGIEKDFELRVFYLDGRFYSMAIFSQLDDQTKEDFRAYNVSRPNRNVPYILPDEIKGKLTTLMNQLHLKTASIDFIVDLSGDYYFLEINPVGQFGMVSEPCNYYLEKKVAEFLAS